MAQATEDSSNSTRTPQLRPEEMRRLAKRLRARAETVLLRHQPEQHGDLLTAAGIVERFAGLHDEVMSSAAVIDRLMRLLQFAGGA